MRKKIAYKIGFEDGEVIGYSRSNNQFIATVKTWNDIELTITFQDAIGIADYGAWSISAFVEEDSSSTFMERTLLEAYDLLPDEHQYNLYQFLNLDGKPSFEIVAQSLSISD